VLPNFTQEIGSATVPANFYNSVLAMHNITQLGVNFVYSMQQMREVGENHEIEKRKEKKEIGNRIGNRK
jgi:hypothetical protein